MKYAETIFFLENTKPGGVDTWLATLSNGLSKYSKTTVIVNCDHPGRDLLVERLASSIRVITYKPTTISMRKGPKIFKVSLRLLGFILNAMAIKKLLPAQHHRLFVVNGGWPGESFVFQLY